MNQVMFTAIWRICRYLQYYYREMIEGDFPLKAQNLVKEWLSLYSSELQKMWNDQTITKLPPLV